jgi:hypothetical protein
MPELLTQASIRSASNLPFCYWCGQPFDSRTDNHPDHIPPAAIFAKADRDFPLKVSAHRRCNNPHSKHDEIISQLIAVTHGKWPKPRNIRLKHEIFEDPDVDTPFLAFFDTGLPSQIWRWVRGFHASLYSEFLPLDTKSAVHPPFPYGKRETDGYAIDKIRDQQYLFVKIIKKNRVARCIDRIVCNNGRCSYECVWVQMDRGPWACVFALQIYNWSTLADKHFVARGCTGYYEPLSGRPANGTKWTVLEVPFSNLEPLDPFGK